MIKDNQIRNLEKAVVIASLKDPKLRHIAINQTMNGATLKYLKTLLSQDKQQMLNVTNTNKKPKGRTATRINLGTTSKIQVVKEIIDCIICHDKYSHLQTLIKNQQLNDYQSLSKIFKLLLKRLEEMQ